MRKSTIYIALFLVFSISLSAQKTQKLCGEYIYHAPENVTLEQAKQTALERAKLQALADKFGTTVTQNNATVVKNENGMSDISYFALGGSEVKGEWLENAKEPEYKITYEQDMLVVKVKVCGKAREITNAGIDFTAKILKHGTEAKFESETFRDGDQVYLLFRSPADGYLAVYLIDESQTAYCLLPYMNAPSGNVRIKSGKEYIFFSEQNADKNEAPIVNEYVLTTNKTAEHNFLYVIFSPNEFTKANDVSTSPDKQGATNHVELPRELPLVDFQQWLAKNRTRDKDIKVEIKGLTITK
ncbi:MAG: DUF4384 domain-containing protein [Candidatus Symbiothrix sp.]|nr:DUF4384 domain-containing protein [Candidatus Symbiothrix sp.]